MLRLRLMSGTTSVTAASRHIPRTGLMMVEPATTAMTPTSAARAMPISVASARSTAGGTLGSSTLAPSCAAASINGYLKG